MLYKLQINREIGFIAVICIYFFANSLHIFSENTQKSKEKAKKQTAQTTNEDKDDNIHYNLGVIAAETKNFKEALNEFSIAIAINPKNKYALYGKGSVFYQLKQMDSAIFYMDKTLQIKTGDELALSLRAAAYQQIEKYPQAIADYNKLIKIDTNNAHYYLNIAYCYQMQNDTNRAIEYYLLAESKGDRSNELYYNLSNLYASKLNYAKSLEYVDKIIEKGMQFGDVYDLQIYDIMKVYNCDSAIHRYSQISNSIEHKSNLLLQIGICKFEEKDYNIAIDLFTESYKIDSVEILNLYYRGFAYARLDSIDKSIADLQEFISKSEQQSNYLEFQSSAQQQLDIFIERKKRE